MKVQRGVGPGPTLQRRPWQPGMAWPWPCWKLSTILLSAGYMLCVHAFSPLLCCLYYRSSVVHMEYEGCGRRPYQTWTTDHSHHPPMPLPTRWEGRDLLEEHCGREVISVKYPASFASTFHALLPSMMSFFFLTLLEPSSFVPFTCGF